MHVWKQLVMLLQCCCTKAPVTFQLTAVGSFEQESGRRGVHDKWCSCRNRTGGERSEVVAIVLTLFWFQGSHLKLVIGPLNSNNSPGLIYIVGPVLITLCLSFITSPGTEEPISNLYQSSFWELKWQKMNWNQLWSLIGPLTLIQNDKKSHLTHI